MKQVWTPEALAKFFHETYEALAPNFGYETRERTRVSWRDVPDDNKALMVAVAGQVLDAMDQDGLFDSELVGAAVPPSVVVNNHTHNWTIGDEQLDEVAKRMTSEFWTRLRGDK